MARYSIAKDPNKPRKPQPKRSYQPGREDMKRALRHIDKLAKMAQKLPGYDTNIALQLNAGKSLRFLEIYSARMEDDYE